jgi:hypothetical protein
MHIPRAPASDASDPLRKDKTMTWKFMSTTLIATTAVLGLGIGSAIAGENGGGPADGYIYPDYIPPGSVYAGAQTPARNVPSATTVQNGKVTNIFGTHSQSQGVWLFPPDQLGGGGNG